MANLHDRQGDAVAVATGDVEPCEHHTTQSRRHVWHRVLYTRQHFPDNHVDRDTFMASLVPNRRRRHHSYRRMLKNSSTVVSQVCVMAVVFWVYSKLVQKQVAVWSLLAFDAVLMATLFTIAWVTLPLPRRPRALSLAKTGLVFAFILASLAPVLRTLTASFSTDTVWALTIALSGFAIVSHDFSVVQPGAVLRVRGTTSLNAAMFASVLVTSRLQSAADVFAFETLCMLMFGLVPIVRGCIQMYSMRAHLLSTATLAALTFVLLYETAPVLAVLFVGCVCLWLACPAMFLALQKYKTEVHGAWDIAQVTQH